MAALANIACAKLRQLLGEHRGRTHRRGRDPIAHVLRHARMIAANGLRRARSRSSSPTLFRGHLSEAYAQLRCHWGLAARSQHRRMAAGNIDHSDSALSEGTPTERAAISPGHATIRGAK